MTTIAERVKEIRIEKRMTQAEFGEKLSVTKQAVANVEAGNNNPSIVFVVKLIEVFNVNANWLLANIGEPFLNGTAETKTNRAEIEAIVDQLLKERNLL